MSTLNLTQFETVLISGAEALGMVLHDAQVHAYSVLAGHLAEWNTRMNLTAVRTAEDVAVKHVLDSLTCLNAYTFPENATVIDIGAGAGFPGLALKIARPDLSVTLLDSTSKKLAFIDYIVREFAWTDVRTVPARAEEAGRDEGHRERYDVVVARAVAVMRLLSEFCLPFASIGGVFLAMKGPNVDEEMSVALSTIAVLGGRTREIRPFTLPHAGGERAIVLIDKVHATPSSLPRLFREMKRCPL